MPTPLFDISEYDLTQVAFDAEAIEAINPHRGDMRLLDAVIYAEDDFTRAIAYKDVHDDEFWVEGHIPGRPIMPGVLMIEAAAQFASFLCLKRMEDTDFLGFVAADDVKFRGQVVPGDRLYIIGRELEFRRRRFICEAQGIVNGKITFEAKITGMPI